MMNADPTKVSDRAKKRGLTQVSAASLLPFAIESPCPSASFLWSPAAVMYQYNINLNVPSQVSF